MKELNIIICGVGGQGNLLIEKVIGRSAAREGHFVIGEDTFGAAQRGGSVLSHMRIGSEVSSGLVPEGKCHLVLGLEPKETLEASAKYLVKDGFVIVNLTPVMPVSVRANLAIYPPIETILGLLRKITQNIIEANANTMAKEAGVSEKAVNMIMTGILSGLGIVPFSPETIKSEIEQASGRFAEANLKAFDSGLEFGKVRKIGKLLGVI